MKKYVVVRYIGPQVEAVILSNDLVQHADMVRSRMGIEVVSAGFFKFEIEEKRIVAKAYGDSSSLRVESRPEQDSKLINDLLNGW